MQVIKLWPLDPYQLSAARREARLRGMKAFSRIYLVLFLALVLPLQSPEGSLLAGEPCPMSQETPHLSDCCFEATMQADGQLCLDMAKCSTAGLPLAEGLRFKVKPLAAASATPLYAQIAPLSRPQTAPWRPPRA
jgi:hypothetical protein